MNNLNTIKNNKVSGIRNAVDRLFPENASIDILKMKGNIKKEMTLIKNN
jgi:hypothetical protein